MIRRLSSALRRSPAQNFVDVDPLRLESLPQHRDAGVGRSLTAHEHIEGSIARVRPSVDRDMALGQHCNPGYTIRLEMVDVNMQERRLRGVHAAAQCCFDQIDVVETLGSMQIDDEVYACATHAVANGE